MRPSHRIAALGVALLLPLAGIVAVAPASADSLASMPTPVLTAKKKKKQQTMIAIGTRLSKGSSTGPKGAFVGMQTQIGYTCLSPNGKKTFNNSYVRSSFTETQFTVVALDGVTKKTGKKWTCTVSMTKPSWAPSGGKWLDAKWYRGKDGTFKSALGTGWTITVKVPQGTVTYVRAMNKFDGKGAKYKPKIGKVPDIWAN